MRSGSTPARVPRDRGPALQSSAFAKCGGGSAWLAACFRTIRPLSSLVVGVLTASAAMAARGKPTVSGVAPGLAMTTLAMFGFTVNDIFDYSKDRAAGIRRPIAEGTLSRWSAAWLATWLLLCTSVLAVLAGSAGTVLAFTAAALFWYSPAAGRYPLCKDVYAAGLCCGPLYYGALAGGLARPWTSYAILACFVLGREILMDGAELSGDLKGGARTIAAMLGQRPSMRIGSTLMLASAAVLAAIVRGRLAGFTAVATLVTLAWVLCRPGLDSNGRARQSRFPMLLGAVTVACAGA